MVCLQSWFSPCKQWGTIKEFKKGSGMFRMENELKENKTGAKQKPIWEVIVKIQINDKDDID